MIHSLTDTVNKLRVHVPVHNWLPDIRRLAGFSILHDAEVPPHCFNGDDGCINPRILYGSLGSLLTWDLGPVRVWHLSAQWYIFPQLPKRMFLDCIIVPVQWGGFYGGDGYTGVPL